jgi:hypothetical protein
VPLAGPPSCCADENIFAVGLMDGFLVLGSRDLAESCKMEARRQCSVNHRQLNKRQKCRWGENGR